MAHGSKQHQKYTAEPVYPVSLRHAFSSAVMPVVNAGAFPATPDKIVLSAAQSVKVLQPGLATLTAAAALILGDIALDDTNDRILLEPGIYEVEVSLLLLVAGTSSDYSVALTTAAQAANDVSYPNVTGAVIVAAEQTHFHTKQYLTVTASRALELHVAWTTAGATGTIRPGSFLAVTRLGNVE